MYKEVYCLLVLLCVFTVAAESPKTLQVTLRVAGIDPIVQEPLGFEDPEDFSLFFQDVSVSLDELVILESLNAEAPVLGEEIAIQLVGGGHLYFETSFTPDFYVSHLDYYHDQIYKTLLLPFVDEATHLTIFFNGQEKLSVPLQDEKCDGDGVCGPLEDAFLCPFDCSSSSQVVDDFFTGVHNWIAGNEMDFDFFLFLGSYFSSSLS